MQKAEGLYGIVSKENIALQWLFNWRRIDFGIDGIFLTLSLAVKIKMQETTAKLFTGIYKVELR